MLETTLGNLFNWKEEIVMAPPVQANGMVYYTYGTQEIDIDRALWFYPLVSLLGGGTFINCCLPVLGDCKE